jgi:hypothetical protein
MSIAEIVAAVLSAQQQQASAVPIPALVPVPVTTPVSQPPPAAAEGLVPNFYEGTEEQCSICVSDFEHGENVLRLVCRHMYHRECWHNYMQSLNQSGARNSQCPNCRGAGTMVAAWRYIDPTLITQRMNGDEQAANELDMFAEQYEINTPRNSTPDTVSAPDTPLPVPTNTEPVSDNDTAAWEMVPTTTSLSTSAAATSTEQPLEAPNLFHTDTAC